MLAKLFTQHSRREGLKIIDKFREISLRIRLKENMDMITFYLHLKDFKPPTLFKDTMSQLFESGIIFLNNVSMVKDSCLQNYNVSYKTPTPIINFDPNKGEEIGTCHEKDNLSYTPL